ARLTGGFENGAIVLPQHREPRAEVIRMADGRHNAERSAEKCGSQLGAELLPRIKRGPEPTRLVAVKTGSMAGPVTKFVHGGTVIVDLMGECGLRGNLHKILGRIVKSLGPASPKIRCDCCNQSLGLIVQFALWKR